MFTPATYGNLIVSAQVFRDVGGFRDYQHLLAWDLALRLLRVNDPVTIERALYKHRIKSEESVEVAESSSSMLPVTDEKADILEGYWRGLVQDGLADSTIEPSTSRGHGPLPDPETRAAIGAALWGLDQIRRVPMIYKAARGTARRMRRYR